MADKLNIEELIDNYIQGNLSETERKNFEIEINNNIDLKEEVLLQESIVQAIKEKRRVEWKANLNKVQVPPPTAINTNYLIAGVSSVIIIGAIAYFSIFNEAETIPGVEKQETEIITDSETDYSSDANDLQENSTESELNISEESIENQVSEELDLDLVQTQISSNGEDEEFISEAQKPILPQDESNDITVSGESSENSGTENSGDIRKVSKFDVEIQSDKKYKFHYQFYNGKLYLYGDFSKSPYELLELNSDKGMDLYMYFDNEYYAIRDNQTEVTKLDPIKNKTLLQGLENLR